MATRSQFTAQRNASDGDASAAVSQRHMNPIERTRRPVIIFVDDEQRVLDALRRSLCPQTAEWDLRFFSDSSEAWQHAQHERVDVLVTDLAMPGLSGFDLISKLLNNPNTNDVGTIVLTGHGEPETKRQALRIGATDLLNKPVILEDMLVRVRNVLRLKQSTDALKSQNAALDRRVNERTRQLQRSRLEIIWRLGRAAEFRDSDTGLHVARVARFSQLIAEVMGLSATFVKTLYLAAPLHDVGKIGIPDAILLKPGRLTPDERRVMEEHCRIGAHILGDAMQETPWDRIHTSERGVNDSDQVLEVALEIAMSHHEHWDGNGYPCGLVGDAIPLSGRIVAIADVYDALTTERVYKAAFTSDVAFQMIADAAGRQFDPRVFAAFVKAHPDMEASRRLLTDRPNVEVETELLSRGEQLRIPLLEHQGPSS